jgi:RNA polymerase primary sigma factor
MRGLVVALLFLLAPGAYSFLKMPSKSFFAAQRTGVDRMQPLNTNPRKIDVGEEASTRFGKTLVKHELLTAADEVVLSRRYRVGLHIENHTEKMNEALGRDATTDEIASQLEIAPDQVPYLLERGKAAKSSLVRANMRLVFHMAKYYRFRGLSYPDLVQEGTFGLMKAVDRYDPDRGFRFSTYASWWIKQSVSRAIAEKSRIVRLPVHIHDLMVSMSRAEKQFAIANNRKPTHAELAERLALPVQKIELLKRCGRDVNSMDESVYNNNAKPTSSNEVQVKDRLQSEGTEPLKLNERNSQRQELRRAMRSLTEREAQIVEMRFGLADGNPMTLEDIGKQFNVTRERIRQIEARALSKMRHPIKTGELKEIFQDDSLAQQVAYAQQVFDEEQNNNGKARELISQ